MLVKELIKKLENFDADRIVILASDEEGNSYCSDVSIEDCGYSADKECVCLEKLTPELKEGGYTEEDVLEDSVPALLITP